MPCVCVCVCCDADDSEEENLESDLGQVGNHAFARMEGDVDKQRKQILQGQMSEAAVQKQHQRKYSSLLSSQPFCTGASKLLLVATLVSVTTTFQHGGD